MYNMNAPYNIPQFGYQPNQIFNPVQQAVQLVKVSGIDGAKAYQMPPNSSVALFHESEDILYVKSTDGAGFPTIRTFRFEPMKESNDVAFTQYVTIDEFNKFKEELNGKFSVRNEPIQG